MLSCFFAPKFLAIRTDRPSVKPVMVVMKKLMGRHADGGKGQLSAHIADDEGVCPVIELLQHTAEDQRQAEPDQLFHDGS